MAYAQISVGEDYVLALKANGTVWAWGRNDYGQLGTGVGSAGGLEPKPKMVEFPKNTVTGYVDGLGRTVVLESDGGWYAVDDMGSHLDIDQVTGAPWPWTRPPSPPSWARPRS